MVFYSPSPQNRALPPLLGIFPRRWVVMMVFYLPPLHPGRLLQLGALTVFFLGLVAGGGSAMTLEGAPSRPNRFAGAPPVGVACGRLAFAFDSDSAAADSSLAFCRRRVVGRSTVTGPGAVWFHLKVSSLNCPARLSPDSARSAGRSPVKKHETSGGCHSSPPFS